MRFLSGIVGFSFMMIVFTAYDDLTQTEGQVVFNLVLSAIVGLFWYLSPKIKK